MGIDRWQAVVCRNCNMSLCRRFRANSARMLPPSRFGSLLLCAQADPWGLAAPVDISRQWPAHAPWPGLRSACVGRLPRPNSAAWARPPGDPTLAQPWARQTAREMTALQSNHRPRVHARSVHPEWHQRSEARCVPLACPLGKPMRLTECAEPDRFG